MQHALSPKTTLQCTPFQPLLRSPPILLGKLCYYRADLYILMSNIIIKNLNSENLNSHLVDTQILNLILDTADICEETKDKPPFSIRQYSTLPLLSKT